MAIKEQLAEQAPQEERLTDAEEQDLSIAVNLAKNLIDDGGTEFLESTKTSKDQGEVIGQFLFQMATALKEKLSGMVELSPRIFLSVGGWVEQVSDYLQEEYGVPKDIMDRAEVYIGGTAQSVGLAEIEKQQGGGAPQGAPAPAGAPPQGPVLPQQGGMM